MGKVVCRKEDIQQNWNDHVERMAENRLTEQCKMLKPSGKTSHGRSLR